jgi:hypothetical protein
MHLDRAAILVIDIADDYLKPKTPVNETSLTRP